MRKHFLIILLITAIITGGCTNNSYESPSKIAQQYSDDILYCFDNNDIQKLKTLFCESISQSHDLENEIQTAFEFFDGNIVSKGKGIGMSEGGVLRENGKVSKLTVHPNLLYITTDTGAEYSIYFCAYLVYENHSENIGITYINVFNSDNEKISIGADII
ncbi:MAG: DUF5104 domain-containing protein [Ruminococcus sp.]|nr:DUF5104 domain-containing protein [Ruminococcus sp.]